MKEFLFLILLSFICVTSSEGKRKEKAFWFFRRKNSVPNWHFRAKYIDTQIKTSFFGPFPNLLILCQHLVFQNAKIYSLQPSVGITRHTANLW